MSSRLMVPELARITGIRRDQRVAAIGPLARCHVLGNGEPTQPDREVIHVHSLGAVRRFRGARPLQAPQPVKLLVAHTGERRREHRDFVHDL